MERGADGAMTGYAFPELLIDVVKLSKAGKRDAAHDLFDAHLPLIRYEQQPGAGLAVRKYVLQKRGIIASSAQRKPGADHHGGGEGRGRLSAVAGGAGRPPRQSAAAIQRGGLSRSMDAKHRPNASRPRRLRRILLLRDSAAPASTARAATKSKSS